MRRRKPTKAEMAKRITEARAAILRRLVWWHATKWARSPDWARDVAVRRFMAVAAFSEAKAQARDYRFEAEMAWIACWNDEHPEVKVSRTTIYRWSRAYKAQGLNGLVPNWGQAEACEEPGQGVLPI